MEEEALDSKTEEEIWSILEKICGRLEDLGTEVAVLSYSPQREVIHSSSTCNGRVFLENNPDCLQRFKDFCAEKYNSKTFIETDNKALESCKMTIQSKPRTSDVSNENDQSDDGTVDLCTENSQSEEDTKDYSDYDTMDENRVKFEEKETERDLENNCGLQESKRNSLKRARTKQKQSMNPKETKEQIRKPSTRLSKKTNIIPESCEESTHITQEQVSEKFLLESNEENQVSFDSNIKTVEMISQSKHKSSLGSEYKEENTRKTCPLCQMDWNGRTAFINHLRVHKGHQLCYICDEVIPIKVVTMETHIKQKHGEDNPWKCKICSRGYKSKNGLKNHFQSMHADSSARLWCNLCKRGFGAKNSYKCHMESHNKGNKCFICVEIFENLELLKEHMRDSHAYYLCLVCSSYFPGQYELEEHEMTHTDKQRENPEMNVDIMDFLKSEENKSKVSENTNKADSEANEKSARLVTQDQTSRDLKLKGKCSEEIIHGDANDKTGSDMQQGSARKKFECKFCGKIFKIAMFFTRHIRLHNNQSDFVCNHCGKVCKSEETFKHHIALHLPDEKKPHHCELCGNGFVTRGALKRHHLVHTQSKDFICETCGKSFRDSAKLKIHLRSHTGERPFKCKLCEKSYYSSDSLRSHKKQVHLPKRSFMCDICGKIYSQKRSLDAHKLTHNTDSLKCEICGVQSVSARSLRRHFIIEHSEMAKQRGYKIFQCEHCNKILSDKEQYDYHIRTHTGERPFPCTTCSKSFRDKKQLKMHSRTHSNEKRYSCPVCSKQFQYNRTMKKHVMSHATISTNQNNSRKCGPSKKNPTEKSHRGRLVSRDMITTGQIVSQADNYNDSEGMDSSFDSTSEQNQLTYNLHNVDNNLHEPTDEISEKSHETIMRISGVSGHHMSGSHAYPCSSFYVDQAMRQSYSEDQQQQSPSNTFCSPYS